MNRSFAFAAAWFALCAALLLPARGAEGTTAAADDEPLNLLKAIDRGFVRVFEKVAPAVVVIEALKSSDSDSDEEARALESFFKNGESAPSKDAPDARPPHLPPMQARSEGSGFIIRADGYIITNYHVVSDTSKLTARLKDGRTFPARLVGADDKTDIAVLRVDAKDLPVAEFGDSDALRVGQLVCAIGAPFNQDYSFTCGWVSGKGRTNLLAPSSTKILYEDYIQTDAFINPGNSGGPLFNVEGKVVGMNTLINGIGRGLAFAIPSAMLQEVARQLIATGKMQRPWLGIRIETLADSSALREHVAGVESGVVVDTIEADAPAYKSDLRPADVIVAVDGAQVSTTGELQREVLKSRVGQTLQLTVWRSGKTLKIPVATGELPGEVTKVANTQPPKVAEPNAEAAGIHLQNDGAGAGALVVSIDPESLASRSEILVGDTITAVERSRVADAGSAARAIDVGLREKKKKGVLLNIDRKGKRTFAILKNSN